MMFVFALVMVILASVAVYMLAAILLEEFGGLVTWLWSVAGWSVAAWLLIYGYQP